MKTFEFTGYRDDCARLLGNAESCGYPDIARELCLAGAFERSERAAYGEAKSSSRVEPWRTSDRAAARSNRHEEDVIIMCPATRQRLADDRARGQVAGRKRVPAPSEATVASGTTSNSSDLASYGVARRLPLAQRSALAGRVTWLEGRLFDQDSHPRRDLSDQMARKLLGEINDLRHQLGWLPLDLHRHHLWPADIAS
jgi:hypothetical protein